MCTTQLSSFVALVTVLAVATAAPSNRVVNGTDSSIEKYPFMVKSIYEFYKNTTGSHSCGGSIISPLFVLTAAHCTYGKTPSSMSIQFGVTNISSKGPNVVGVRRIVQHKDYNSRTIENDISLLEVERPFPIDYKTVAPVTLPELNFEIPQVKEGAPGVLAGWGLNGSFGVIMTHLQEVNLKIYSDDECRERHGDDVFSTNICGGVDEGYKGQCSGDSGGPLLLNGNVQVGIVSWSIKPCTVPPYPGVYTKVARYIDWIKRGMFILA